MSWGVVFGNNGGKLLKECLIFNSKHRLNAIAAAKVGNMNKAKNKEMQFWTKGEYFKFADAMMDKPLSFYAFEMLCWCGIREEERLSLTPAKFDFKKGTVKINKSFQRLKGCDVITDPKTEKSNRTIKMPQFLCAEMLDYIKSLYSVEPNDRIFQITKYYLLNEMNGRRWTGLNCKSKCNPFNLHRPF